MAFNIKLKSGLKLYAHVELMSETESELDRDLEKLDMKNSNDRLQVLRIISKAADNGFKQGLEIGRKIDGEVL